MNVSAGFLEGLREIRFHKFRSFLTMFGIILGVASLLSMFALTAGSIAGSKEVLQQVGGLERITIVDAPIPPTQEGMQELSPGRTYLDAVAIRQNADLISYVSPEVELGGSKATYSNKSCNPRLIGVEPDMYYIEKHSMSRGRFITPLDLTYSHRVCVIGRSIVEELWGDLNLNPIGESIRINGEHFQVVGIFDYYLSQNTERARKLLPSQRAYSSANPLRQSIPKGNRYDPFWPKNRLIAIPLTTMQLVFKSSRMENGVEQGPDRKLSNLTIQVKNLDRFQEAIEQVRNILLLTHRGIRDFATSTKEDWFVTIQEQNRAMKLTGGVIAGISLLVGGLGIANTMLASISERVREIGIRRAVGARASDIFVQILIEALVLAMLGGFFGVFVGWGLSQGIIALAPSQNNPIIEPEAAAISFGFAIAVGFFAGLYPAWYASKLSPLQALRYE